MYKPRLREIVIGAFETVFLLTAAFQINVSVLQHESLKWGKRINDNKSLIDEIYVVLPSKVILIRLIEG